MREEMLELIRGAPKIKIMGLGGGGEPTNAPLNHFTHPKYYTILKMHLTH